MIRQTKKGLMSIEATIGLLLLIVFLAILLDMLTLSNRYMTVHDTAKELSRTIAVQGGALSNKPKGYPNNYYTSTKLANLVDKLMKNGGFRGTNYSVYITYTKYESDSDGKITADKTYKKDFMSLKSDGTIFIHDTDEIDYLNDFTVTIVAKYDWFFSKLPLGIDAATLKASAPGISEWKYDYDRWEGE